MCIRDRYQRRVHGDYKRSFKKNTQHPTQEDSMADVKSLLNNPEELKKVAKQAFDQIDTDKSGNISKSELQLLMNNIAKSAGIAAPTPKEVDEAMKALDTNNDGTVSFDEFIVLVREVLKAMAQDPFTHIAIISISIYMHIYIYLCCQLCDDAYLTQRWQFSYNPTSLFIIDLVAF
eukprot:TRINITY_DN7_c0_g2_i3.p1 TRINITY_DN7_c0_g2~~TRINITY_DN7_c0_g2_i3.p1  ORF type:complete len:176 (-),score=49.56 TRINITY_DN7_c0_g2_i3:3-530(-)